MKFYILIFLTILLLGCTTVVCNSPYIFEGEGCCLDQNDDKICDSDAADTEVPVDNSGDQLDDEIDTETDDDVDQDIDEQPEILFIVSIEDVKNEIRILDQAVFILKVDNLESETKEFFITTTDSEWTLTSNLNNYPIKLFVLRNKSNRIKLSLQPDKNSAISGIYQVPIKVTEGDSFKIINVQVTIME